ncbi:MAG: TonB-dependent receptor, partial [Candidatus Marinimicrobia bacterium]|nr:TonB-dependent receptor [Candidatus Neomarinimicrobiota bacterium]
YNQSGFTFSGPIIQNKIFFFVNAELERRDDPGSNFVADRDGTIKFGESRVDATTMNAIRQRMMDVYNYDTGPYENYTHATENNKLLVKLDWNISQNHKFNFRYNLLDAVRDLPPHGFVLSYNNTGRGPNSSSLPFKNSGYAINNELNSYSAELNSIFSGKMANKLFFSYNRFRDFRDPFSEDFPTVEIGEDGVTYTTVGHEPFSIHNILDQDVLQITNNFSYFMGKHVFTLGLNYEQFKFFNSFNIFRHGLFMLPYFLDFEGDGIPNGSTISTLDEFFAETDPDSALNLTGMVGTGPYKGEAIDYRQFSVYAQDEFMLTPALNLTYGLRIDIPIYQTEPVENSFSTSLACLDENDKDEKVDQAKLPDSKPLFSPRLGFNWDVTGDRSFQLRGGTGIFTGRMPFVWYGNVISNPGTNPKLYPGIVEADVPDDHETDDGKDRLYEGKSILQQSFDLNAMVPDFKLPQVWTTNIAVDKRLPMNMLGTLELVYGKDINAIYMRNADLVEPVGYLDDGRPYFGAKVLAHELNTAYPGENAGVYVIDNTNEGHNFTITTQLRKFFNNGLETSFSYTYLNAKNNLKST